MATDHDLSALLPKAPPPRPDRREDAIAAAMRRFDGDESHTPRPAQARRRSWLGGPAIGAMAAAALVAAIGLPLWLSGEQRAPMPSGSPAVVRPSESPAPSVSPAPAAVARPEPLPIASPEPRPPGIVAPAEPASEQAKPADVAANKDSAHGVAAEGAPPPPAAAPPPPPPAMVAAAPAPPTALRSAAPAPSAVAAETDAADLSEVVVTGSRVTGQSAKARKRIERRVAARGVWNACTINDPGRDLAACRRVLPSTAPGAKRRAAALVGDGLTRAWQGDLNGAITEFDRAIGVSPDFAGAWLNRGLARTKAGDDAGGLADLDKAVRYAPTDARAWFQRSLILRRQGKTDRANADAARAAELDRRYEAVGD